MMQIVLDAEKIFTTSEKIITALLGALFGFCIKALFDRYIENRRRRDIRNMIYIDLDYQKKGYEKLVGICKLLILYFKDDKLDSVTLPSTNLINSNIFKTHTARDYYKSFHVEYYQRLLGIYYLIDSHSKNLLRNIYDKYVDEINGSTEENYHKINNRYIQHVESIMGNYKDMIIAIDKLSEMAKLIRKKKTAKIN